MVIICQSVAATPVFFQKLPDDRFKLSRRIGREAAYGGRPVVLESRDNLDDRSPPKWRPTDKQGIHHASQRIQIAPGRYLRTIGLLG